MQPGRRTLVEADPPGPAVAPSRPATGGPVVAPPAGVPLGVLFGGGEAGSAAYRARLARPGYGYLRPFVEPVLAELDRGTAEPEDRTRAQQRLDAMFAVSHSPDGHGLREVKQASNAYHAALGAEAMQAFRPGAELAAFAPDAARHAASYTPRLEDGVQMTAEPHGEGVEFRIAPNDWRDLLKPLLLGAVVIGAGILIYRAVTQPTRSRGELLLDAADRAFADVARRALPGATIAIGEPRTHKLSGLDDHDFTIRLMTCPLGDRAVKPIVNPTKDAHVLQLSEQLTDDEVARALAGGIAEIAELRRVVRGDRFPVDQDLLRRGPELEHQQEPSARDLGAVAELRELCAQHRAARRPRAAEIFLELVVLLDQLGLRHDDDGAEARWAQIKGRLEKRDRQLVKDARAKRLESDELEHVERERQTRDEQREQRERYEAPLHDLPELKGQVSPEEAQRLAQEAERRRADKSAQTLEALRRVEEPRVQDPQVGGGAALTAVRRDQHLIDDRGRWQKDPSHALAQTAIQLRAMLPAGLGDPLQFVERPSDRLPLAAVCYFEDSIAAQAQVVDGTATLSIEPGIGMVLHIAPADGQGGVDAIVDGTPLIASGFPRERVPGQRQLSTHAAITQLMDLLDRVKTDEAEQARRALATVDLSDHAAISQVLERFPDALEAIKKLERATAALAVLGLHGEWATLRQGREERVLQGDHANLNTLKPNAAERWVIAGVGGTSISAAEIILHGNPRAKVTMIGGTPPNGLNTNDQFVEVYEAFGPLGENRFDVVTGHRLDKPVLDGETISVDRPLSAAAQIDGTTTKANLASTEPVSWLALALGHDQLEAVELVLTRNRKARVKLVGTTIPREVLEDGLFVSLVQNHGPISPDPRLEIASGDGLGALKEGSNGEVLTTGNVSGEGYVNTLGRGGQGAPVIEDLLRRARLDHHRVAGELLWSDDDEYLGYRIRITSDTATHAFDVTGAASRFLPDGVFSTEERDLVMAREGHTPRAAAHDAPAEGGNFDGGFVASATQAARYGRARRRDGVRAEAFRSEHDGGFTVELGDVAESGWTRQVRTELAAALEVDRARVTATQGEVTDVAVTFTAQLGVADLGPVHGRR